MQFDATDGLSEAQVKEKTIDIDFKAVVQATDALMLVGTHVEAVARLSADHLVAKRVPEEARQRSAFFRVWCLGEMAAALEAEKPVVLLVGAAAGEGEELHFEPNEDMLYNLYIVMDIEQAAASWEEDRARAARRPAAPARPAGSRLPTRRPPHCGAPGRRRCASSSRWRGRWGSTRSTRSPEAPWRARFTA